MPLVRKGPLKSKSWLSTPSMVMSPIFSDKPVLIVEVGPLALKPFSQLLLVRVVAPAAPTSDFVEVVFHNEVEKPALVVSHSLTFASPAVTKFRLMLLVLWVLVVLAAPPRYGSSALPLLPTSVKPPRPMPLALLMPLAQPSRY